MSLATFLIILILVLLLGGYVRATAIPLALACVLLIALLFVSTGGPR